MASYSSEYVFSAPAYLGILPNGNIRTEPELFKQANEIVTAGVLSIKNELKEIDYPMIVSLLFNAFTERKFGPRIALGNGYGFDRIYSDSGGLQIITRGMTITPELKRQVYAVQSKTDLAMCFDHIPVRAESAGHRQSTLNKTFHFEDFEKCAIETAENIKEQIETFIKLGCKTKAFFIVQGNTLDDMMLWFKIATDVIPWDYWERIQGIAIGGACMGTGQLEDIEKLIAYGRLKEEFDPHYVRNHLHILGVGSINRLYPLVILRNTGFIGPEDHVSYDSSTLSMAYIYGTFQDANGGFIKSSPLWEDTFKFYYNKVGMILKQFGFTQSELDEFYPYMVSDMLCHKKVYAKDENDRLRLASHCIKCLANIFQIKEFTHSMYDMNLRWDTDTSPIGMLKNVKTVDDFNRWKSQYGHAVPSQRITRKGNSLETHAGSLKQNFTDEELALMKGKYSERKPGIGKPKKFTKIDSWFNEV